MSFTIATLTLLLMGLTKPEFISLTISWKAKLSAHNSCFTIQPIVSKGSITNCSPLVVDTDLHTSLIWSASPVKPDISISTTTAQVSIDTAVTMLMTFIATMTYTIIILSLTVLALWTTRISVTNQFTRTLKEIKYNVKQFYKEIEGLATKKTNSYIISVTV